MHATSAEAASFANLDIAGKTIPPMPDSRDDLRAQNVLFHLPAQPAHLIVDGSVQWTGDPAGAQFEQLVAANDRPWPLQEQGQEFEFTGCKLRTRTALVNQCAAIEIQL